MFRRLRRALVESFVGAIALGYLFAQAILHFAGIFSAPVAGWLMRREYPAAMEHANVVTGFSMRDGLPELVRSLALLLVGYLLLRWLYFAPLEPRTAESVSETTAQSGSRA
jgi:predicted acyltransferase